MKAKEQKSITLEEIINVLDSFNLNDARERLYTSRGASLTLSATVLKVTKREMLHLQVETSAQRQLEAFAHFSDKEFEKAKEAKVKKGSKIQIVGHFQTCGERAINVSDCRLVKTHLYRSTQKSSSGKPKIAAGTRQTTIS